MNELQQMNDTDLKKFVSEKREALRANRFNASGSGLRDTHARKNTRKDVARALTELNRRAKMAPEA